jgi:hypothetical protein
MAAVAVGHRQSALRRRPTTEGRPDTRWRSVVGPVPNRPVMATGKRVAVASTFDPPWGLESHICRVPECMCGAKRPGSLAEPRSSCGGQWHRALAFTQSGVLPCASESAGNWKLLCISRLTRPTNAVGCRYSLLPEAAVGTTGGLDKAGLGAKAAVFPIVPGVKARSCYLVARVLAPNAV